MEPPHFCYWKQGILSPTGHLYKLHFLVFSIADLGTRGRTRCDSSPSWRKRPNHPPVIPCFNIWRHPILCYTPVDHILFYPQISRSVFLESHS
ncbi:hypothetical protein Hanom_Chr05g00404831 [Helianthus anomalus]